MQQQRWTKRGPDFVESGEKAMQALQKDQENFEQAQQEVIQETDLDAHAGDAYAGSPAASDASCTSQREPGENLGSFDGDHRT